MVNVETFFTIVHLKIYTIYYNSNFSNTITLVNIPMQRNYDDNKSCFLNDYEMDGCD